MSGPLTGLRIIEMTALGPVPLAGQLMADLGAEVTVIDRRSGPADLANINRRNKKSVALNLKSESGIEVLNKLISQSDILIEGFRPGVMEKLGIGPEPCHALNPWLIIGRMTGWGQKGPLSQSAGHDINYLSITGALHAIGHTDEPPVPPLNLVADYGGGAMFLVFGVLSALYERSQSGQGQVVDTAMVDGVPAMMGLIHMLKSKNSWSIERESNMLDGGAPFYRCYETADAKHIGVGAIEPQFFAELVSRAGLPESDLKIQHDQQSWPDMTRRYAAVFKTKTRDQWTEIFEGSDGCVAPVLNFDEAHEHHHNTSRGTFIAPDGVVQAAPAPRFDRTPATEPVSPAAPGGDTSAVLAALGYTADEIAGLRGDGVLT